MAIVWSLAKSGGHFAMENMLLAGFAIGTMLNAATAALALRQEETNPGMRILAAWLHGEVTVPSWTQLSFVAIIEVVALLFAMPLARQLNTLALSEEYAAQLGVRVERLQVMVIVTGSILTGARGFAGRSDWLCRIAGASFSAADRSAPIIFVFFPRRP